MPLSSSPDRRAALLLAIPGAALGYAALPFPLALCSLAALSASASLPLAFAQPLSQAASWQMWRAWWGILCGRSNIPKAEARLLAAWTALSGFATSLLVYFLAFEIAFRMGHTGSRPAYQAAQLFGVGLFLASLALKRWGRKLQRRAKEKRS